MRPLSKHAHPLTIARTTKKMSLDTLAGKVQCNKSHLSRIERGLALPSPEMANKIALTLGGAVSRDELLFPPKKRSTSIPAEKAA